MLPIPVLLTVAVALSGCGGDETADAARDRAPKGAGPTRQVAATTGVQARPLARGFRAVTGLVSEPGRRGRTLVLEQVGTARWLDGDGPAAGAPFLDLRPIVKFGGEQGLLGLAFLPRRGGQPQRVAVHHSDRDGNTRVALYALRGGRVDPTSGRTILQVEQPYANHNGGAIVTGRDGRLYLGLGDGGSAFDPRQNGQDLKSQLGKLLRYDPAAARPRWQIVAYGLRNPWRTSVDPRTGDLWIGDVGEQTLEEIDRLPYARTQRFDPPTNFGWAAFEGSRRQQGKDLNPAGRLTWPVASYAHRGGACSVTGGVVVRRGDGRSATPRALADRYVFGDFCNGVTWSVAADGRHHPMRREPAKVPRQSAYLQDARGRVLVGTVGGQVLELR
ncbi:PQQ-dependent sugar dehydrogenase [Patulibacter defluvii]|uniref:PQQ-dependent sugar dehydrogenase n=1 Tax=Patulibacter defluvii TaxID=3095358 RepID=UPI002A74940F|nr:PQQ-dependent sugar dehydrogenase [Patulibacter sp. DM4]